VISESRYLSRETTAEIHRGLQTRLDELRSGVKTCESFMWRNFTLKVMNDSLKFLNGRRIACRGISSSTSRKIIILLICYFWGVVLVL